MRGHWGGGGGGRHHFGGGGGSMRWHSHQRGPHGTSALPHMGMPDTGDDSSDDDQIEEFLSMVARQERQRKPKTKAKFKTVNYRLLHSLSYFLEINVLTIVCLQPCSLNHPLHTCSKSILQFGIPFACMYTCSSPLRIRALSQNMRALHA